MQKENIEKIVSESLASAEGEQEIPPQEYYDASELKKEIQELLSKFTLEDLSFDEGQYHLFLDSLGSLEEAAQFFGVSNLGIEETETGFSFDGETAEILAELPNLQVALDKKATEVAAALNLEAGIVGSFFFDFDEEENSYDLMYFFEDGDLSDLEEMGIHVRTEAGDAAFSEILAALEHEGCHDIAERLHAVLFMEEQ